jgi:hypothetical protein
VAVRGVEPRGTTPVNRKDMFVVIGTAVLVPAALVVLATVANMVAMAAVAAPVEAVAAVGPVLSTDGVGVAAVGPAVTVVLG